MSRLAARRAFGAAVLVLVLAGACSGGDGGADAGSARTCEQLVERAGRVARQLVEDLRGKTSAELAAEQPDDPLAALTEPFEPFQARAEDLGCDRGELRRLACTAYQGIEPTGPLTEEFLARVDEVCG